MSQDIGASSLTSKVLMIEPVNFGFNSETAGSNDFQNRHMEGQNLQEKALREFHAIVEKLLEAGVSVEVISDTPEPVTPDSIFPNNWVSFHEDGRVCVYPMMAKNRRGERRRDILERLSIDHQLTGIVDLTSAENDGKFLEGTGSMVLDRANRIAYATPSSRTDPEPFDRFCHEFGYEALTFLTEYPSGQAIYHTNVVMAIGEQTAVVCLEVIPNPQDVKNIVSSLAVTGRKVVPITLEQMEHFAGNMMQVATTDGGKLWVMSDQAFQSLTGEQRQILSMDAPILSSPIPTIEGAGGGSARCMLAEVFLPMKVC